MAGGEGLDARQAMIDLHLVPRGAGELRQVLVADPSIQGEYTLIVQVKPDADGVMETEVILPSPEGQEENHLGVLRWIHDILAVLYVGTEKVGRTEPTEAQIQAFKSGWEAADAAGLRGERVRHGLIAAMGVDPGA